MFQVLQYIRYWLKKVDEHSLHSPFLFDFYAQVIKSSSPPDPKIEEIRTSLLKNHSYLDFKELGAGSRVSNASHRKVSQIARHVATPLKFSMLLTRLIQWQKPKVIIELGTSLGLNTMYMSKASENGIIHTFEGVDAVATLAENHFNKLGLGNIDLVKGDIDETLSDFLETQQFIDLAYLDANHKYEPTLRYFDLISGKTNENSIVVVDDIYWSKEMMNAWKALQQHPKVSLSLDLFEAGILFFRSIEDSSKPDWILDY